MDCLCHFAADLKASIADVEMNWLIGLDFKGTADSDTPSMDIFMLRDDKHLFV